MQHNHIENKVKLKKYPQNSSLKQELDFKNINGSVKEF